MVLFFGKDKKKKKITPKKMKEVKKVKQEDAKEKEKKERKVYDLPGQKHDPPEDVRATKF